MIPFFIDCWTDFGRILGGKLGRFGTKKGYKKRVPLHLVGQELQDAPRCLQDALQMPQDAPKMTPRCLQDAPRCLQDAPRCPQDGPKMLSRCPQGLQVGPKLGRFGDQRGLRHRDWDCTVRPPRHHMTLMGFPVQG